MKKTIWLPLLAGLFLLTGLVLSQAWSVWREQRTASIPVATLAGESVENSEEEVEEVDEEAAQNLALFFGQDDREFITEPYPQPFAAIGKLETRSGSHCTATLVAPDLAVTAAHCFLMLPKELDNGVWFWAGFHEGRWLARYQVVSQHFDPRFKQGLDYVGEDVYIQPQISQFDIAWMKLKRVDGIAPTPIPLFQGNDRQLIDAMNRHDNRATQAGYAHDHNEILTAHRGCKLTGLVEDDTVEHQCDTLSGDSGSPLFLETAKGPLLIGVQSAAPDWYDRDKADNIAVTVLNLPKRPK